MADLFDPIVVKKANDEKDEKDPYNPDEERQDYIDEMERQGFVIVFPAPNELQIDMDTDEDYEKFKTQFALLSRDLKVVLKEMHPSRNGYPGRHATVIMPHNVNMLERIAWQSVLGSDPQRERLSMIRWERGDLHPTLFVERSNWNE